MRYLLATVVLFASAGAHAQRHPHAKPHAHAPHAHAAPAAKVHGKGMAARAKAAAGQKVGASKADEVEQVEQVEQVESVEALDAGAASAGDANAEAAKSGSATPALALGAVLGHLHAAVVHLPIAWLALWSFFEALGVLWAHPWLLMSGLPMGVLSVLSFAPAVYTGLARLDELAAASPGYDVGPAQLHRNLLFLAWALCGLACVLRLTAARPGRGFLPRAAYLLLVWIAFAVTGWSAHLGGCMVYGDDFLPF